MVINPLVSGFHISCLGILFMRLRYHVIYRTINMGSYGFVLKWSIPINGTLIWKSWEFDCWVPMFRQTHMGMGQNLGSCLRLFIYVFMIHLLGYLILTHIDARKWALVSGKKKRTYWCWSYQPRQALFISSMVTRHHTFDAYYPNVRIQLLCHFKWLGKHGRRAKSVHVLSVFVSNLLTF